MKAISRTLYICALILASACSDEDDANGPAGSNGTVTTSVSGTAFSGSLAVQAYFQSATLIFGATQTTGTNVRQINATVSGVTGPNTFSTGNTNPTMVVYTETNAGVISSWSSALNTGTGSLKINTMTATRVTGEFVLIPMSAVPGTAATGTKQISGGTFDLKLGGG